MDYGIPLLIIIMWHLLVAHLICSYNMMTYEGSKVGRLARLLPGETLDVLVRTVALTSMYFCKRNDKQARSYAFMAWLFCIVLLFCRTI